MTIPVIIITTTTTKTTKLLLVKTLQRRTGCCSCQQRLQYDPDGQIQQRQQRKRQQRRDPNNNGQIVGRVIQDTLFWYNNNNKYHPYYYTTTLNNSIVVPTATRPCTSTRVVQVIPSVSFSTSSSSSSSSSSNQQQQQQQIQSNNHTKNRTSILVPEENDPSLIRFGLMEYPISLSSSSLSSLLLPDDHDEKKLNDSSTSTSNNNNNNKNDNKNSNTDHTKSILPTGKNGEGIHILIPKGQPILQGQSWDDYDNSNKKDKDTNRLTSSSSNTTIHPFSNIDISTKNNITTITSRSISQSIVQYFLPTNYPKSVATGYYQYALYSFLAAIAGSANMILSTQTLLIAVMGGGGAAGGDIVVGDFDTGGSTGSETNGSENDRTSIPTTTSSEGNNGATTTTDTPTTTPTTNTNTSTSTSASTVSTVASLGIMAGAWNWVLKDCIGQIGGIYYISVLGQGKQIDMNPRYWKFVSLLILDAATLLEIGSLSIPSQFVLPLACTSTLLKNIAFITTSASRATIHQTLITIPVSSSQQQQSLVRTNTDSSSTEQKTSTSSSSSPIPPPPSSSLSYQVGGNLGDVTAKSGSQSMAGGVIGTTLGMGLSSLLIHTSGGQFHYYLTTFVILSMIHQTCNYISLQAIVVRTLNLPRLQLVVNEYITKHLDTVAASSLSSSLSRTTTNDDNDTFAVSVLTPEQIAKMETFVPFVSTMHQSWNKTTNTRTTIPNIQIGASIKSICPKGPYQVQQLRQVLQTNNYLINIIEQSSSNTTTTTTTTTPNYTIHLIYTNTATTGIDIIQGYYHATMIQKYLVHNPNITMSKKQPNESVSTTIEQTNEEDNKFFLDTDDDSKLSLYILSETTEQVKETFPNFIQQLYRSGWNIDSTDVISIEPRTAKRIQIIT